MCLFGILAGVTLWHQFPVYSNLLEIHTKSSIIERVGTQEGQKGCHNEQGHSVIYDFLIIVNPNIPRV